MKTRGQGSRAGGSSRGTVGGGRGPENGATSATQAISAHFTSFAAASLPAGGIGSSAAEIRTNLKLRVGELCALAQQLDPDFYVDVECEDSDRRVPIALIFKAVDLDLWRVPVTVSSCLLSIGDDAEGLHRIYAPARNASLDLSAILSVMAANYFQQSGAHE